MGTASARFYQRNTVSVGPGGAAWPFVALRQPGALFFEYDAHTHSTTWSSGNCDEVLGASEQSILSHGALFLAHLHSSDRFRISSALEAALASGVPYVATYRWVRPDNGEVRLLHCRAILDGDGESLRGFITDLTSESALIRAQGDVLETIVAALETFDSDTLVIDSELRVRHVGGESVTRSFGLGLEGFDPALLQAGRFYADCFGIESSRRKATSLLQRAIELNNDRLIHEWPGCKATFRCVLSSGTVEGILIQFDNDSRAQELEQRIKQLEAHVARLSMMPELTQRAADLSQELVGYAAIVTRTMTKDPMVRHLAEALVEVTRELGAVTRELNKPVSAVQALEPRTRNATAHLPTKSHGRPVVMFASSDERTAAVFASLLKGNGLNTACCSLIETTLRESLMTHSRVRLLVLDVPASAHGIPALIRAIRRFFPALHIVCLVPGATHSFPELQRTGVGLLLAKPVTPRALERVVRSFLALAAGTEAR